MVENAAGVAVGAEVGHRDAEMDLRRGADAEFGHAADHAGHAGRLAHREDLRRVEQSAGLGDVDVRDVGGAAQDHLHRRARVAHALVGHQRNADRAAHLRHAVEIVRRQRLLDELEVRCFHRADDGDRLLRRLPSHVAVDAELDVRPDRRADRLHGRDVARRIVAPDLHLDRPVAPLDALLRESRHVVGRAERNRIAERDAIADLAAEKIVDRRVERLADDVPERHLDRRPSPPRRRRARASIFATSQAIRNGSSPITAGTSAFSRS